MIVSLLIKFGMLALTMGVILWIGWAAPDQSQVRREAAVQPSALAHPASATAVPATAASSSLGATLDRPELSSNKPSQDQLDLNRATEQEFQSLPGIGPVLAGRIVEYRNDMGPFRRVEDLRCLKGIGKNKLDQIRKLVRVTGLTQSAREGKKKTT